LEQLRSLNCKQRLLQHSKIPSTAVVNFNNSNRETKVSGTIIAAECNVYSDTGAMAEKCLRSRSIAAFDDRQGNSVVTNLDENVVTNCVQITDLLAVSDVTQHPKI
jgi:hypothetical protein